MSVDSNEVSKQTNLRQAKKFLDFLYHGKIDLTGSVGDATGSTDEATLNATAGKTAGFLEFRFRSLENQRGFSGSSRFLSLPIALKAIEELAFSQENNSTVWFGAAPRRVASTRSKQSSAADVEAVVCLWAEILYRKTPNGVLGVEQSIESLPLRPSIVVETSRGKQIYFAFREAWRNSDLPVWFRAVQYLRYLLRIQGKIDIGEMLILPGTEESIGESVFTARIVEDSSGWVYYSCGEIKENFCAPAAHLPLDSLTASANSSYRSGVVLPALETLQKRRVAGEIIEAVVTGVNPRKTLRAGASGHSEEIARDVLITIELLAREFTIEEIKALFRAHPTGCGSRWVKEKNRELYLNLVAESASIRFRLIRKEQAQGDDDDDDFAALPLLLHSGFLPPGYDQAADGSIWLLPVQADSPKQDKKLFVSSSLLRIVEILENIDTGDINLVVAYTYLNRLRTTRITRTQMCSARQLVAALAGGGAPVTSNNARQVVSYLAAYESAFAEYIGRKKVTGRFGRVDEKSDEFFLPGLRSEISYIPLGAGDESLYKAYAARRGSLNEWVENINVLAEETLLIPQVAILAALVPPLQKKLQIPNFILDIHGGTSSGKSTTLKLAASVYGKTSDPDSLVLQWMNTRTAVEQVAGMCSELPIFLDDAQHCPHELIRSVVYMVANGKGKTRGSSRGVGIRETLTWHTVALSTSEDPLHSASQHEGARGRILSVGGISPAFRPGSSRLVNRFEQIALCQHGYAGAAFINHLNGWRDRDWSRWRERYAFIRTELQGFAAENIAGRVSSYIAAIQVAGEIAAPLLGLNFQPPQIAGWLLLSLGEQHSNQNLALQALRTLSDYFMANSHRFAGSVRYRSESHVSLHGTVKQHQYVGFLRSTVETVFQSHKWNSLALLDKIAQTSALVVTEGDRYTKKVTVDGVKYRMICVKWSALLPDDFIA